MNDLKNTPKEWKKGQFLISTDPSIVPINQLNAAFVSDDLYWAVPLPFETMKRTLKDSLCFGVYDTTTTSPKADSNEERNLIGFARCVTDFTTLLYLTDVYVLPEYRSHGLGKWLIKCVEEVIESLPYLRRCMLYTSNWKSSVPFYEKYLGMTVLTGRKVEGHQDGGVGAAVMDRVGPGFPPGLL